MIKVCITGGRGMIGWHLRCYLQAHGGFQVSIAGRDTFSKAGALAGLLRGMDVVVHLAGMNRGDEQEVRDVNVGLAKEIVSACDNNNLSPHILFSSSTHIDRDTPYGESKRICGVIFRDWAERNGTLFSNLVFPHVYGESGKPFYNSVVSTFCHQLAAREEPSVHNDGDLELVHAQAAARHIVRAIENKTNDSLRVPGHPIRVTGLLSLLRNMHDDYLNNIVPNLDDPFIRDLFNVYRSYLYPAHYPVTLKLHSDDRGSLFEAVKTHNGGQTFLSSTRPGITRGNHYHLSKVERFLVVSGSAVVRLRKLFSDEVIEFEVNGTKPQYLDIPTLHTHNISNVGDTELVTLFWANEIFNPEVPDTFPETV